MSNIRLWAILFLAPPLFMPLPTARATVMVKMELKDLVGRADVIIQGRALESKSQWSEDRRRIVTDTVFQVERALRGARPGSRLVVRSLGGSVDGIGMWVPGSPSFSPGDRVLLFSDKRGAHRYVTGMQQGIFPILPDRLGRQMVRPVVGEMKLARQTPQGLVAAQDPPQEPVPLQRFLEQVQRVIDLCDKDADRCVPR